MKIMVIGMGSIGSRHLANLRALRPEAQIIGADPDAAARERAGVMAYADWRLALRREQIEAAIIASPTAAHLEQLAALIEAGIPTLVEKPPCAAGQLAEYGMVVERAAAQGARAAVGFSYRFHPAARRARQRGQTVGLLDFVAQDDLAGRYGRTVAETMGSHSIDLALWTLGAAIDAELASNGLWMFGSVRHVGGHSTYFLRMDKRPRRSQIKISGAAWDLPPDGQTYIDEVEAFLRFAGTGERGDLASLEDGLAVMRVIETTKVLNV